MTFEIDIVILVGVIIIAMAGSAFAGMVIGYIKGVRQAEKQFCDKYITDKPNA
jgi:hypothetical protein